MNNRPDLQECGISRRICDGCITVDWCSRNILRRSLQQVSQEHKNKERVVHNNFTASQILNAHCKEDHASSLQTEKNEHLPIMRVDSVKKTPKKAYAGHLLRVSEPMAKGK